jgi:hypothetical protein
LKLDVLTAERIGANWLRAALAPVSDFGRRAEDVARPFGPDDRAAALGRCTQIARLAESLRPDGMAHLRAALRRAPDPTGIISRATVGDPLSDVDFLELGRFADALENAAHAWDGAGGSAPERPPVVPALRTLLGAGFDGATFYLADGFGGSLAEARAV